LPSYATEMAVEFKLGVMNVHARDRQKQHERFLLDEFLRESALTAEVAFKRSDG
jgi:hypothetical protein